MISAKSRTSHLSWHDRFPPDPFASWLLLFTVEISANASDGEEVFHPDRLGRGLGRGGLLPRFGAPVWWEGCLRDESLHSFSGMSPFTPTRKPVDHSQK